MKFHQKKLQNKRKTILITGTTSGFGLLTAAQLSPYHNVWATVRTEAKKHILLEKVKQLGGQVNILEMDVTKISDIEKAVAQIQKTTHNLDILINNAGIGIGGVFENFTHQETWEQLNTNLFGTLNVTRACLPLLRASNNAKIINISSIDGMVSTPGFSLYSASKWAIEGWSEGLRLELRPFNIEVINVLPGFFKTNLVGSEPRLANASYDKANIYHELTEALQKKALMVLKNYGGDPILVANLIEKIINTQRPKFRYFIGKDAVCQLWLKKLLPFHLYETIVYRTLVPRKLRTSPRTQSE